MAPTQHPLIASGRRQQFKNNNTKGSHKIQNNNYKIKKTDQNNRYAS